MKENIFDSTLSAYGVAGCCVALAIAGCTATGTQSGNTVDNRPEHLENSYLLPAQKLPPQDIQTVRLHRKGEPNSLPLIRLGSGETLLLEFDFLGSRSSQFRARVSHRDTHWRESAIGPNTYLDSYFETYFGGGDESLSTRPQYRHYEYEFPNNSLSISVSGNYLLEIYDYDSGGLLFTVPFLVSEDRGDISTRVQELFARQNNLRTVHQPASDYRYPDFVEMPGFDLSFFYLQNRFWGKIREAENTDTSTPGSVHFYVDRDRAFTGDYEFNILDLRQLDADGRQILEVRHGTTPPEVILRRDIQHLSPSPRFDPEIPFGLPVDQRSAFYADVHFTLDAAKNVPSHARIYIVGDFNNWGIDEANRMNPEMGTGLWKGRALVKQGEYAYKYVRVTGNAVDDLALDRGFTSRRQEYTTLVYFRDPARHYHRLLKAEIALF